MRRTSCAQHLAQLLNVCRTFEKIRLGNSQKVKELQSNMAQAKTIFLVDDDEDDFEFMHDALTEAIEDVRVVQVQNPFHLTQALEANRDGSAKLILLDVNMPAMNGFELLASIKHQEHYRPIPVVMVSTTTNQQQVNKAYSMGANAFIVKPVTMEEYRSMARGVGLCFLNSYGPACETPPGHKLKIKTIVVVEDNDDYWYLMNAALKSCMQQYNIIRIVDTDRMNTFLNHELHSILPPVDLILVDLYLPDRQQGLDLIRQIRSLPGMGGLENIPVIVFSYSDDPHDIDDAYSSHASAYLIKPVDLSGWSFYFENLLHFWSDTVRPPRP
ncbi:DNA-binding transcriptional response regulator, NtrC family, contains REC, AAA-type ATPase, and a Fis-type DNA-binding domains [Dyadobacter soli]|uniref:DNA-binding transcriptional response regulator, NtrC family, contains REC, AAA-type ATPase, and a Fis-type DNA-binding domains n=1 Tax=Dyadobacter soli TaxID=659014 RepID=A0A1G7VFQ3_9BACT|nr:response regulator [Dyadobacter soli]SDG58574.1 DNA-binding transcriptional response regulator, NtrC family, contains REC, AAA-type ATPase, and a Fis-type DNA-binding domains [Dyadobacter soli]